jgi:hypothetical protein
MLYCNSLASKKAKKNAIESARNYLIDSLGGVNAMKNKRPMCGGQYNSTEGFKVSYFHISST